MINDERKFIGGGLATEVCEEELPTVRIISSTWAPQHTLIRVALRPTIYLVAYKTIDFMMWKDSAGGSFALSDNAPWSFRVRILASWWLVWKLWRDLKMYDAENRDMCLYYLDWLMSTYVSDISWVLRMWSAPTTWDYWINWKRGCSMHRN